MRVAFNATSLLSPLTGIGQYSRQIALGLVDGRQVEAEFFYGAGWSKSVRTAPLPGAARLLPWLRSHVPWSYELRRHLQSRRFAAHTRRAAFELYHEPNILPLPFDGPLVLTVHDLSWIRYPQAHPIERVRAMDKYFESGLRRASLVVTDSAFVRNELIDLFGLAAARVRAIPLGFEPLFHPRSAEDTRPVLARHGLVHGQYLLAVGTLEPRKNLQLALRAFMALAQPVRSRFPLVLVGMKGWHQSELERQIAPLVATGEVRVLGYLARDDLAAVTAGARALVYPSLYEGFGLPPLEAMACGVPVIASNVASLPEVVGDAGILVDPADVDGLANAMHRVALDETLHDKLSTLALHRSRGFSWDRCVAQTLECYVGAVTKCQPNRSIPAAGAK